MVEEALGEFLDILCPRNGRIACFKLVNTIRNTHLKDPGQYNGPTFAAATHKTVRVLLNQGGLNCPASILAPDGTQSAREPYNNVSCVKVTFGFFA